MSSEWSEMPFGDFISLQRGHDLPEQEREEGGVPILGSFGVTGWHNKAVAKAPGLTIGRSGASFGTATYTEQDYFPLNTTLYVNDFKGNHPRFAYYFSKHFDFSAFNSGSAQPSLNRNFINPVKVSIPPLAEQKAIAHILGTLDDKIELNRKTNETLEAMAKALFKSWFVDFDPVRAKAEGRPTGLPAEISALFPDSFEDSELGEIPSGWEIALLGDHIDLIKGRSYKSDELNPSTTALVTLKSFQRNGGYRPDGLKGFTGEYKEQQVVKPGELVIALTDVTQAADVIGRPAIVKSDSHCSTLVASLDVGIVRPKTTGCFSTQYLYFLMLTPRYVQHILGYTSGTTVLHLAKDGASNFPLPIGILPLLNHFAQLADSILRQVDASARQSELLAKTRDALLPKLISGEIRIPDAERMLEEVGL